MYIYNIYIFKFNQKWIKIVLKNCNPLHTPQFHQRTLNCRFKYKVTVPKRRWWHILMTRKIVRIKWAPDLWMGELVRIAILVHLMLSYIIKTTSQWYVSSKKLIILKNLPLSLINPKKKAYSSKHLATMNPVMRKVWLNKDKKKWLINKWC